MQEQPRRSLRFEPLEPKHLMAGNVTVTLTGVNLLVSGDDAANQIAITAGDAPDTLVVRGLQGTTVTLAGSTTPAPVTGLVVPNVRGHVRVETGGGNDEVSVTDLELRRRLSLQTGDGNDQVALQDVSVGGLLSIAAGAGNDTVRLGPQNAPAGPLQSYADASVKSALAIDVLLGDGEDTATLASTAARGAVVVAGGMGADAFGFDSVRASVLAAIGGEGDGADTIQAAHARALAGVF
ncbi:MAG TPA: hypothetical protein VEQ85_15960, partial [Lacipirellulaceae bacterium]|nr:hypothetical protein [Lacipirellulaceae bacterium]